ncbi:Histone acetyltransferase [Hanseniaspora uvarum DSM 2768]|uniref:histone acetyltransferase n=1 Tax=Hanseniaspora uvarum TaxID=29833 RepID=A0A1E5RY64_HANUV|nr:hypothetical protein FOG48_00502 [Hanseniaspora uvarum]KAF0277769.1 hypothetical protein FOG50_01398 [Hanseniaspora uvarum]KKA03399.1 Histone acetyltransferase [Hanseniaspora uvarum DSM 2768]OEJ91907.1 Histone acetyltransferase [Hanseniaspora uvarum]GMM40808.1 H3 histone acetyltransferase [Hanseniaspora uvarum]
MASLQEFLKEALPENETFEVFHLVSPTREIKGFKYRKHNQSDFVAKASHFLAIAHNNKVFFAIDINVYFEVLKNKIERTIFVSKADTNGYLDIKTVKISSIVEIFLRFICKISPLYYLKKVIPLSRNYKRLKLSNVITKKTKTKIGLRELSRRAVAGKQGYSIVEETYKNIQIDGDYELLTNISMFTRPEPHYLFTDSGKNPNKHCLQGDKLLKWWLRIVDNLLIDDLLFKHNSYCQGVVSIPGEESAFITSRYVKSLAGSWSVGFLYGNPSDSLFKIPFFNDDPKTRFLRDLIDEDKYEKYSIEKFWVDIEVRQEFRAGVVVGVIGIKGLSNQNALFANLADDSFIQCISKQEYKRYKSYVVGEEYESEEGACDSRDNLYHQWTLNNKKNFTVIGKNTNLAKTVLKETQKVNTLTIRKKTR